MLTKEQKIKVIYEKIGEIQIIWWWNWTDLIKCKRCWFEEILSRPINVQENCNFYKDINIWDVLDYIKNHRLATQSYIAWVINLSQRWIELRKPIEEQSDECIDFVFNLIKE